VVAPCQGEMMALFTCWSLHSYDETACSAAYLALQSCSRHAVRTARLSERIATPRGGARDEQRC
jgi:hypothetical protein